MRGKLNNILTSLLTVAVIAVPISGSGEGFGPQNTWHDWFSLGDEIPLSGDFNGDGRDDVITFARETKGSSKAGHVWVAISKGDAFMKPKRWHKSFAKGKVVPLVGDFNGDKRSDIAYLVQGTRKGKAEGDVWVALSNGQGFGKKKKWHEWFSLSGELPAVGDFNGDGKDDLVTFDRKKGLVWVALSVKGKKFGPSKKWSSHFAKGKQKPLVGDFNGDRRSDIALLMQQTVKGKKAGDVEVSLSTGSKFHAKKKWHDWFSLKAEIPMVGDFDGNHKSDLVSFVRSARKGKDAGDVWVSLAGTKSFKASRQWATYFGIGKERQAVGDFNGDGRDDVVTFVQSTRKGDRRGDVIVSITGGPTKRADKLKKKFGWGMWKKLGTGVRPMLVLLLEFSDTKFKRGYGKSFFKSLYFGPKYPNQRDGFLDNSHGLFKLKNAGVLGPFQMPNLPGSTADESKEHCAFFKDKGCKGSLSDDKHVRAQAVLAAVKAGFNFKAYDKNKDGRVTDDELLVTVVTAVADSKNSWGSSRPTAPHILKGKGVDLLFKINSHTPYVGFQTLLHETAHSLKATDIYGSRGLNFAMSLMGPSKYGPKTRWPLHFDPWHKMAWGWTEPRIYSLSGPGGCVILEPTGKQGSSKKSYGKAPKLTHHRRPVLLYDERQGHRQFFMLEYRKRRPKAHTYDGDVIGTGVAVWAVKLNDKKHPTNYHPQIQPGKNKVLDTKPAGDDVKVKCGALKCIGPGPDGLRQSKPKGDDKVDQGLTDRAVYVLAPNAVFGKVKNHKLWSHKNGTFRLPWRTGEGKVRDAELALRVSRANAKGQVAVKWAWHSFTAAPTPKTSPRDVRACLKLFNDRPRR